MNEHVEMSAACCLEKYMMYQANMLALLIVCFKNQTITSTHAE